MNPRHRNPPGVDIGLRIAQYRRRRKWSQAKLALRAGMPRPYVGKVEMGLTIPNPKQVLRFSEALNVGIELLIEPPGALARFKEEPWLLEMAPHIERLSKYDRREVLDQAERIVAMHHRMRHAKRLFFA